MRITRLHYLFTRKTKDINLIRIMNRIKRSVSKPDINRLRFRKGLIEKGEI